MSAENLALWDSVFTTDPAHVKPITGKTYRGHSPKPYWIIQRATEVFGPIGIGWGFSVKSERFERVSDTDTLHTATVSVWYVWQGKRSEAFDHVGGTMAAYRKADGSKMIVDEDAAKKSVTDALVKALSCLGFCGDIFSGMWDDSKYVEQAGQFYASKAREQDPQRAEWLTVQHGLIFGAANVGELRRVVSEAVAFAQAQDDGLAVDQINQWADEKRAQAKPKAA
jgi:hypothetical protein